MRGDVYLYGIVTAIVIVGLIVAAILMTLYVIYYYLLRRLFARTTSIPATVVRKTQREYGGASSSLDGDDLLVREADAATSGCDLFLLFDVGGKQMEFPVPESVYVNVEEGDTGLLIHKGTLFRRFVKDAELPIQTGRAQIRKV